MDIFFTSVSHGKLGRQLHEIYMPMGRLLNEQLGSKDYGPGLQKWFLLFAMLPDALAGHDETERGWERKWFDKKNKAFDLRLRMSNDAFWKSDAAGRKALVAATMLRSLGLIAEKKLPDFDVGALRQDVEGILREEGWIA